MTVQGQSFSLGGRLLEETEDMNLGKVGVLDTNIYKKAKVNTEGLAEFFAARLANSLDSRADIRIPLNQDKPDAGEYSSRPLVYDITKYPYTATFAEGSKARPPLFSLVAIGGSAADYRLDMNVTVRSEIFEILTTDQYIQNKYISALHKSAKGDYYLSFLAYVRFSLVDVKTGKVVMNEKTKTGALIAYTVSDEIHLSIANKDAAAYQKYLRTYDFDASAKAILAELADGLAPFLRPLYKNANRYVKTEE